MKTFGQVSQCTYNFGIHMQEYMLKNAIGWSLTDNDMVLYHCDKYHTTHPLDKWYTVGPQGV